MLPVKDAAIEIQIEPSIQSAVAHARDHLRTTMLLHRHPATAFHSQGLPSKRMVSVSIIAHSTNIVAKRVGSFMLEASVADPATPLCDAASRRLRPRPWQECGATLACTQVIVERRRSHCHGRCWNTVMPLPASAASRFNRCKAAAIASLPALSQIEHATESLVRGKSALLCDLKMHLPQHHCPQSCSSTEDKPQKSCRLQSEECSGSISESGEVERVAEQDRQCRLTEYPPKS